MAKRETILAGDVGGTKTLLALFTREKDRVRTLAEDTFSSSDYPGLEGILKEFLRRHPERMRSACFGLPGPVSEGKVMTPNVAWERGVEVQAIKGVLKGSAVILLNDLEATGYGLRLLSLEKFVVLHPGRSRADANAAIIAAGTGLGEAILFWDGREHRPSASEGSHCDFAPRTQLELEFFGHARARLGRVSYDRVVSGSGLHLIYSFLRDTERAEEPAWLRERLEKSDDPAAVISEAALARKVPLCEQALDMFVSIYGAEAGNLALKALARAGVYVAGGIAPKILPKLADGTFVRAFTDKGRLSDLLAEMPVRVVLETRTALYGAAYFAARQLGWKVSTVAAGTR